jgi:eukaryotic-like serine/threonine-protein kinase
MPPPTLIGAQVGNYVIKELLGRGGMSTVYRAVHPGLGREVAVKVLAANLALDEKMSKRFELEARTAAALRHPHIIEIYDQGRLQFDIPYYTMELLGGQNLESALKGHPVQSAGQMLPHVAQICSALQAAHDRGIVHRDLKPNNVFVLEGEPPWIKLLDFGIAKLLESSEGTLTTTGMVLGSSMWAAPEQLLAKRDQISPRTDLYSLGVMIYWMLCGAPPFESQTSSALAALQIDAPPPPLHERNPKVPAELAALVHRCLEKDPSARPGSAAEVASAYKAAIERAPALRMARVEEEMASASVSAAYKPGGELSSSIASFLGVEAPAPKPPEAPALPTRVPSPIARGTAPAPRPAQPPMPAPAPEWPPRPRREQPPPRVPVIAQSRTAAEEDPRAKCRALPTLGKLKEEKAEEAAEETRPTVVDLPLLGDPRNKPR